MLIGVSARLPLLVFLFLLSASSFDSAVAFTPKENLFAPSADLWPRWSQHDDENVVGIDSSDWDRLLKLYVRPAGRGPNLFDYAEVTAPDRQTLRGFLDRMASLPISLYRRDEQLAYWINLYNALTVSIVLDHYPVASIRDIDISPGLFADGPWDKTVVTVEGKGLTLNDIEHRILRPIWRDPRIHYAVNCASLGCPSLRAEAYSGDRIEAQLDQAARRYINDPRGLTIDDGRVTVSKIYDWYYEDFGGSTEALLRHLIDFASPALAAKLRLIGTIHGTHYDWHLNDAGKSYSEGRS